ncbi:MAG: DUF5063 domain-containing protein [Muribaculaceae bacterium]|nr:DUF5063 domain-containing protein [Muribaculaceae bacterium]
MKSEGIGNNGLAFIALSNEYCQAVENARDCELHEFVALMVKLLPRIYITATDINVEAKGLDEPYLESSLDEDYYDSVRRNIEYLLGPDDTYLEVFEEDMKYSDTPIAVSISEGLSDIFQVLYNFLDMVKDAPTALVELALVAVKDEFESYWSRILCNVLRALNHLRYNPSVE